VQLRKLDTDYCYTITSLEPIRMCVHIYSSMKIQIDDDDDD
jgi:hypothetical protein